MHKLYLQITNYRGEGANWKPAGGLRQRSVLRTPRPRY